MEKRLFTLLMATILFSSLVCSSNHFTKSSSNHHLTETSDTTSSTDTTSSSSSSTDSSTTSSSSSQVWMYGTCIISTLFFLVVLIYVCYHCSKFCKNSSRYGAKGGNTQFSNEQDAPPYDQYGNYGAGAQNYTQGQPADPYAQPNYKYGY